MAERWIITSEEDDKLQALSADAQVIYLRLFRRHMDYDTGRVAVTLGQMKRCLEYLPDPGSQLSPRRVADIGNNYVRARVAELERAGLIAKTPKSSRFDAPSFCCILASVGEVRPKREPQRNHKEGTTRGDNGELPIKIMTYEERGTHGTTKEPQGGNHKNTGIPVKIDTSSYEEESSAAASRTSDCPHQAIIDLYHEILPANPLVKVWDSRRQGYLRARWREERKRQDLDYWRKFFTYIANRCPFLTGQKEGMRGPFTPDLEWMVRPRNFAKIIERQFEDQHAA